MFRTLVFSAFLRGIIPGVSKNVGLPFGDYKTVATFLALVNNAYVTAVSISECIKCVTDKVHLENSLFGGHRFEREGLNSDLKVTFLNVLVVIILRYYEGINLYPLLKSGLILSDLSFKALDCSVKSCNEGIALLFTSEGRTSIINGNFDYLHSFTNLAGYEGLSIFSKEFVEFEELLFNRNLE